MPSSTPLPPSLSPRQTWLQRSFILLALLAVLSFQTWTIRTSTTEWPRTHGHEDDYYNLLSRGFLSGHLYLKKAPDPELLKLSDPYDPQKRVGIPVLHDVSYYRGKYYLYWGPAPVVTLFLPFRVITGSDLPQLYGNLLYVTVGFLALAALWLRLRQDFFPQSRTSFGVLGVLALGACGMTLSLVRRPSLWELPISSGHAFAMIGLWCAYSGLRSTAIKRWWIVASLALGLAVASRPTYVVGIAPLLLVLAWGRARLAWQSEKRRLCPPREWWTEMLALGIPFGAVIAGLLIYNYERFDHPLEFGLKYQMSAAVELTATHFSPHYAAFNGFLYYLSAAQWSRYFPFAQLIHSRPQPSGYYGIEYVYGLFVNEPLTLLAFLAPLAFWRRTAAEKNILAPTLLGIALFYLGVTLVLLCFWAGTQRYMSDFAPALVLLGCTGLLAGERRLQSCSSWTAKIGQCFGLGLAGFSIFFGTVISFQLHGLLKYFSPQVYQQLAHALNYPAYSWEKTVKFAHGPIELDLRFPKGRAGKLEPLLSTGWEFFSDQVFVYYVDDHHLRIGFDHVSRGSRITDPIELDYGSVHHLRLELGSLYPPQEHPLFDGKSDLERASLTQWLRIVLDDKTVMEGMQPFYDASPESVQVGGTSATAAYGERFTGEIVQVKRGMYQFLYTPHGSYGSMTLKLGFPRGLDDRAQPLVGAGVTGRADTLYVRYLREGYVRFGYDHWGVGAWESDEVAVDPSRPQELEIYMPALFAPHDGASYSSLSNHIALLLDKKLVWSAEVPGYNADPSQVSIGRNFAGSSVCEYEFSGVIGAIKRDPGVGEPSLRQTDRAELRLIFPPEHIGQNEPLFTRGSAGAADILIVHYIDHENIQFSLDHWGVGQIRSALIGVDFDSIHSVGFFLSPAPGNPAGAETCHFDLILDGHVVWSGDTLFYPAKPETVTVGRNQIGASTCQAEFGGAVLGVKFPPATAP